MFVSELNERLEAVEEEYSSLISQTKEARNRNLGSIAAYRLLEQVDFPIIQLLAVILSQFLDYVIKTK